MKIIATSDLHGNLPKVPKCDLLLVAGDICPDTIPGRGWARIDPSIQEEWLEKSFLPWWYKNPAANSHATWGNHDFIGEHKHLKFPIDELVEVNGLRIWFSPWSPQGDLKSKWAFMIDDDKLERVYDAIPPGIDILVSHCPPYGFGDVAGIPLMKADPHLGSRQLLAAIKRIKPRVVICGHIHGGYGVYQIDETTVYNVAHVDEAYRAVNPVVSIELK